MSKEQIVQVKIECAKIAVQLSGGSTSIFEEWYRFLIKSMNLPE